MKQQLAILGSTGSIGVQTLDVVRQHRDLFDVAVLTSNCRWQELVAQSKEFEPDSVVIADERYYNHVKEALSALPIKVYAGTDAIAQIVDNTQVDVVVNALVGYAGLKPTINALRAKKRVALANKESLVVAGALVMKLSMENGAPIVPIDSEHSAILQSIVGERGAAIEKIILTASGGPFRTWSKEQMSVATVEQTLAHPKWVMGRKITVDSASLINKGFEVIEAHWLFGVEPDKIDVVIHPQSVIHSMVEFADGAIKAQLGVPDMHLPIQYALTFPERLPLKCDRFSFVDNPSLTFEAVDKDRFPNLGLAYQTLRQGGNSSCILNAANEVAVERFLSGEIGFCQITDIMERSLAQASFVANPTEEDYFKSDIETREIARKLKF